MKVKDVAEPHLRKLFSNSQYFLLKPGYYKMILAFYLIIAMKSLTARTLQI